MLMWTTKSAPHFTDVLKNEGKGEANKLLGQANTLIQDLTCKSGYKNPKSIKENVTVWSQ